MEINNSFYRLPSSATFANWRDQVPPGFVFAAKASRTITHFRKLRGVEGALQSFTEHVGELGPRLGPLLYQLPPNLHRDAERLEAFLKLLRPDLRHVIEFRHSSWFDESVFDLLRQYSVALCLISMPGLDSPLLATAPFIYVRFHGMGGMYQGSYPEDVLRDWAGSIQSLSASDRTAYIYFNNDENAHAVRNALTLSALLSSG